jgi:hypothetical protein
MNFLRTLQLLAAALLGGGLIAHGAHVTARQVIRTVPARPGSSQAAAASRGPDLLADLTPDPAPSLSPASGAPAQLLVQAGAGRWQAMVLLNDTAAGCQGYNSATYWLVTTEPARAISEDGKPSAAVAGSKIPGQGSSCDVTVTFTGLARVPATGALIIDQTGASSAVTLTVSRRVTLTSYLVIPAVAGGAMAILFLIAALLLVRPYDRETGKTASRFSSRYWYHSVPGSGAWSLGDSWATNISTGLVVVGSVLATATAVNSMFPGVTLDRFAIANIAAGGIVVAAPVFFGIYYGWFTGRNPGPSADAVIGLHLGQEAVIGLPSGAGITLSADAGITAGDDEDPVRVRVGTALQVAPGATISVRAGDAATVALAVAQESVRTGIRAGHVAVLEATQRALHDEPGTADLIKIAAQAAPDDASALTEAMQKALAKPYDAMTLSGGSDIAIHPGCTLMVTGTAAAWTIQKGDITTEGSNDAPMTYPAVISAPGGAKITVTGAADITLPARSVITSPWRTADPINLVRHLTVPQGSNIITATLSMLMVANVVTLFGLGAELGIASVLTHFSVASAGWQVGLSIVVGLMGVLLLSYAVTAMRAMVDPQPGSSLNAESGASFTL